MADTKRESRPETLIPPLSAQGLDRFAHFAIYHLPDGHLDVLGAGGMGTTYRAFDLQLERPVALKVIHPQHLYHPDVRSRFLREAKATARLQHPNIAGILYQGEENGICFYAMELVSGEDLENYVHRVGPLDPVAALQICHQVLLGLDAAYQVHLLHRDLKPANIMLTRYHDHRIPHVKVIDFGLAKFLHDMPVTLVTRAGFMGTPGYASPEQCQELAMDCRSDLYSLGATFWYLLTGRELFEGSTLSVIQAHVQTEPDYSGLPMEPGPVHYVLQRLLAKRPEDRPETPMQAIHDVEYAIEALGGPSASTHYPVELKLPPPGPPPTLVEREESVPAAGSSRRPVWIGSSVLLLSVVGLLIFWLFQMKRPEADKPFVLAPVVPVPPPFREDTSVAAPSTAVVTHPLPEVAVKPESSDVPVAEKSEVSPLPEPVSAEVAAPSSDSVFSLVPEPQATVSSPSGHPTLPTIPAMDNRPPPPPVAVVRPDATGEKTNSLGMKLVPLPFLGGDNWICVWETRLKDYKVFATETKRVPKGLPSWKDPGFMQSETDPVVLISLEEMEAFCLWLTEKEKAAGLIQPYQMYRLPTRLELDAAAGRMPQEVMAQIQQKYPNKTLPRMAPPGKFPWGEKWPPDSGAGNFADETAYRSGLAKRALPKYNDGFPGTSPVGSFSANPYGIFDLAGNVWEANVSPDGRATRLGGSWFSYQENDFSMRDAATLNLTDRETSLGFRCVLVDQDLAKSYVPPSKGDGPRGNMQQGPPDRP